MANDQQLLSRVNGNLSEWYCSVCPWSVVVSGNESTAPAEDIRELFVGHICIHNQRKGSQG